MVRIVQRSRLPCSRRCASSATQMEALHQVGVAKSSKHYERLRREAQRLGVELPATWASLRSKVAK
jgi:hypothetical protein